MLTAFQSLSPLSLNDATQKHQNQLYYSVFNETSLDKLKYLSYPLIYFIHHIREWTQ